MNISKCQRIADTARACQVISSLPGVLLDWEAVQAGEWSFYSMEMIIIPALISISR